MEQFADREGRTGRPPRVFVSYAHESPDHKAQVWHLVALLRGLGVDAHLDAYYTDSRRDWYVWMTDQVARADFVLAVASPRFKAAAEGRSALGQNPGARTEAALLRDLLHGDRDSWTPKLIPVILPGYSIDDVPLFLQPRCADRFEIELTEAGVEDLLRVLTGQPRHRLPALGSVPHLPPESERVPTADAHRPATGGAASLGTGPAGAAKLGSRPAPERGRRSASGSAVPHQRRPDPGRVPAQLPLDVDGFTGRDLELDQLDSLLGRLRKSPTPTAICAITGQPGVGKTALAVHWAHRAADRFPDGQLYINLGGFDPSGTVLHPADAIRGFLDGLGVDPTRLTADLDAQAALYRTLLNGRRVLVVLDNARDTEQIRRLIPGSPGCLVIATSRRTLTGLIADYGALSMNLGPLTSDQAHRFMKYRLSEERLTAEPEAARQIVATCDGLPLALRIVAARVAIQPEFPLSVQADKLRDSGSRLDALETPEKSVRKAFSWSHHELDPQAARLFRLLGLHPGADISAHATASLAGIPLDRVTPLLGELTSTNLVTEHAPGRYRLHDLLHLYALELARGTENSVERDAAVRRLVDHYVYSALAAERQISPDRDPPTVETLQPGVSAESHASGEQAMRWFQAEHHALLAALDHAVHAGLDRHVWAFSWALYTYFDRQGHWNDGLAVWKQAIDATRRLNDRRAQATVHRLLARAYTQLAQLDDAHVEYTRALELCRAMDDRRGQAKAYAGLARVFDIQGQYAEALDRALTANELYCAVEDRFGKAKILSDIGWYHARSGDYQRAHSACMSALGLHQDLGNREAEADTFDSLGYVYHNLGTYQQSIWCYQRSSRMRHELGNHHGEAETLARLGDAQREAGHLRPPGRPGKRLFRYSRPSATPMPTPCAPSSPTSCNRPSRRRSSDPNESTLSSEDVTDSGSLR